MRDKPERHAVLSGVGQSAIGRRLFRTDQDLTCEAALEAIADAGLQPEDIDGLARDRDFIHRTGGMDRQIGKAPNECVCIAIGECLQNENVRCHDILTGRVDGAARVRSPGTGTAGQ